MRSFNFTFSLLAFHTTKWTHILTETAWRHFLLSSCPWSLNLGPKSKLIGEEFKNIITKLALFLQRKKSFLCVCCFSLGWQGGTGTARGVSRAEEQRRDERCGSTGHWRPCGEGVCVCHPLPISSPCLSLLCLRLLWCSLDPHRTDLMSDLKAWLVSCCEKFCWLLELAPGRSQQEGGLCSCELYRRKEKCRGEGQTYVSAGTKHCCPWNCKHSLSRKADPGQSLGSWRVWWWWNARHLNPALHKDNKCYKSTSSV